MKRDRLKNLDRFLKLPGDSESPEENLEPLAEIVGAEIIKTDGGTILKIVDNIDLFPYSEIKDIDYHLRQNHYKDWHFVTRGSEDEYDPASFLFFDTETTGLSGGAGMVIFLCGFGYFVDHYFRVVQYFLPDYPDEPFFLKLLCEHIRPETVLVSYNGKAFDWPFIVQRLTMNRMAIPKYKYHLDSLFPARSLFRQLGEDCSLISLEKNLLSFDRGEDIPGFLIPSKYFDYLYDRQPGRIPEIIRHNRLDVISLALVTRYIPEFLSRPEIINSVLQLEGVISHLFKNRKFTKMIEYIESVSPGYIDECSTISKYRYSLALKSIGNSDKASLIWKSAADQTEEPDNYRHLLELAKYQEHKEKDPLTALETVDLMLAFEINKRQGGELIHRKNRLVRKCRSISPKPL